MAFFYSTSHIFLLEVSLFLGPSLFFLCDIMYVSDPLRIIMCVTEVPTSCSAINIPFYTSTNICVNILSFLDLYWKIQNIFRKKSFDGNVCSCLLYQLIHVFIFKTKCCYHQQFNAFNCCDLLFLYSFVIIEYLIYLRTMVIT